VLQDLGANYEVMVVLCMDVGSPSIAHDEPAVGNISFCHLYGPRAEIEADVFCNSLLQQKASELARSTSNLEHSSNPGSADAVRDYRPKEIVIGLIIGTVITAVCLCIVVQPVIPIGTPLHVVVNLGWLAAAEQATGP